jgi:iron complex transport system ATP-binding protein
MPSSTVSGETLSKEKRLTVVMSLHDLIQAYRYAEKAVFLNNSRVHAMGRVEEVMSEEVIEAVYGVKVKVIPSLRAVIAVS